MDDWFLGRPDTLTNKIGQAMGAFAEYAVVSQTFLAWIRDRLWFEEVLGVPLAGLTAPSAARRTHLMHDSRLFIPDGAGGVGTFALRSPNGSERMCYHHRFATRQSVGLVARGGCLIDYTTQRFEGYVGAMEGVFDLLGGVTLKRRSRPRSRAEGHRPYGEAVVTASRRLVRSSRRSASAWKGTAAGAQRQP